jgi:hypothetical protein
MKTQVTNFVAMLASVASGPLLVCAHDPITTQITWNREVSRIVYSRCALCHHDGGSAFSLMTYQVARPWAKAIKEEVLERRMPPFAAVKGFGPVHDDAALTQEELHLIADWVEGDSPEGDDPKVLPKMPDFNRPVTAPTVTAKAGTQEMSAQQLIDNKTTTVRNALSLIGARVGMMTEGSSIQAVVRKPDGSIEPLIWIYDYKPKFDRAYYFEKPIPIPAGSEIDLYPPDAGTLPFW